MKIQKTIKCKIIELTNVKREALKQEFSNLQALLQLERCGLDFLEIFSSLKLYSTNKQQALRFYKTIHEHKEYPISIRNDVLKIEMNPKSKISKYWCRIPNKQKRNLWVACKPHIKDIDFSKYKLCESKLFHKKDRKNRTAWWIYITIQKEKEIKQSYSNIISIDLGSKVTATVCGSFDNQRPTFYGREIRGIRRHYQHLRRDLGKKKLMKKMKDLSNKEQRTVNDILHNISKKIVKQAEETDSYIVLGDLKGIRNSAKGKGKKFNNIVSNMPYDKLTHFIEYKANNKGILVKRVSERNTSRTCSRCGYSDKLNRKTQGCFKCKSCGFEINADVNGARNILKIPNGYMLSGRAGVTQPQTAVCSI